MGLLLNVTGICGITVGTGVTVEIILVFGETGDVGVERGVTFVDGEIIDFIFMDNLVIVDFKRLYL